MDLNFNKDELQKAIITRAVDELVNDCDVHDEVRAAVRDKIENAVAKTINARVDAMLAEAMQETLNESITPVNTWGEKVGKPTTLKAVIHERARDFWNTKVNSEGKATTYSGKPRWEHLLGEELRNAFSAAIKQDMVNIAGSLKDAVRKDFYGAVDKGLSDIFKVNSKVDQDRKAKK